MKMRDLNENLCFFFRSLNLEIESVLISQTLTEVHFFAKHDPGS